MIYRLLTTLALILSLNSHTLFAENGTTPPPSLSGRFFNLSYIGNELSFTTATPAWFYQFAGISSLTSGFNFLNCTPSDNGFCLFSVSDTLSGTATLRGPAVQPTFKLCLNGVGNTYSCESLNMAERFAYVTNLINANGISLCPINSTSGAFGTCTAQNPANLPAIELGFIAINPAGTIAYVGNNTMNSTTISLCPINMDGTLGACTTSNGSGTFNGPFAIAFNNAGSIAYVTNTTGNTVSVCPVNANGSFGTCSMSNGSGTFNGPVAIALNNAGSIAYVTNLSGNTVSVCPVNANGSLGTCSTSNGNNTFQVPEGIALNNAGSFAYVVNLGDSTVSLCPVNIDGSFGTCSTSNGNNTFQSPAGIALF
jgi:DNA-binding beta-propeller fold protein YncE